MAASTAPTVRPECQTIRPGGTAAVTDRIMVCPAANASADAARAGWRRWGAGWLLAASLVVFLVGGLAAGAWAAPAPPPPTPSPTVPAPLPTGDPCAPQSPLPACHLPSTTPQAPPTPPTRTTPCTGEDCIPQPTTASPSTGSQQPGTGGDIGDPDCGLTNIGGCISKAINSVFGDMVNAALSPILELIGHTALSTPTLSDLPGIGELWNNSWQLVVAAYGLFVLVGGIVVMSHESVQIRYSIKEIGPRIPIAFLASALSLFFADKFIQLANALTLAVLGGGVAPPSLSSTLQDAAQGATSEGLFIILVGLVLVVVGLGLLIVYVIRIALTLILIISGPLFLMCHALPHTEPLAKWWWKAITAVLAIQIAQALVLITAVRTFLSSGVHLFGSTLSALGTLVAAIALFFILFKIPFWLLSAVRVSSHRSFLGGLARAYIAAKTFGMVAGKTGAFGKSSSPSGAAHSGSAGTGRGGASNPPWPAQPRLAPTPELVNKRLRQAHDAERTRAARQTRPPSQVPRFLQPQPQHTTHDPAVTPTTPGPPMPPEFSSAPTPATPRTTSQGTHPDTAPPFQAPGAPRRRGTPPPSARPIRTASVPPQLRFQPPTAAPPPSRPVRAPSPPPAAPVFRQPQPQPTTGDARPRTPSAPPPVFRPPKPARGGDTP